MDVFRIQSTKLKPGRKQEGWDSGVLGPASCPPLMSLLLICPPHPPGALAVPSPGLLAVQLLEMGRERKLLLLPCRACVMGEQPLLVPSCSSEEDPTCQAGAV